MVCPVCNSDATKPCTYPRDAEGEVRLIFDSGNVYELPRLILHLIADHGFFPDKTLVGDVMNSRAVSEEVCRVAYGRRFRIGFLRPQENYEIGHLPGAFLPRFARLVQEATDP